MSIRRLKARVAQLLGRLRSTRPTGVTAEIASIVARIEAEPSGPGRALLVYGHVDDARHHWEPGDFAALLAAIKPEHLAEQYPDGPPSYAGVDPIVRARSRAWKPTGNEPDEVAEYLAKQVAEERLVAIETENEMKRGTPCLSPTD